MGLKKTKEELDLGLLNARDQVRLSKDRHFVHIKPVKSLDKIEVFSTDVGTFPRLVKVKPEELYVEEKYQRELNVSVVQKICASFNWAFFGTILIAPRENGGYNIVDGQHRVYASMLHPDVEYIPAILCDTIVEANQQAEMFIAVNQDRKAVSDIDKFWASLESGEIEAHNLNKLLLDVGIKIPKKYSSNIQKLPPRHMIAITQLKNWIKLHGELPVNIALRYVNLSYPTTKGILVRPIIQAILNLVLNYPRLLDKNLDKTLIDSIRRVNLLHVYEEGKKNSGSESNMLLSEYISEEVRKDYNKNFGTNFNNPNYLPTLVKESRRKKL